MSHAYVLEGPAAVTPGLPVVDRHAAYWLAQVNLRLRREVSWCWHQRHGSADPADGRLPRVDDPASDALDWVRFQDHKAQFFASDTAARYLTARMEALDVPPLESRSNLMAVETWGSVATRLALSRADQFVLALALAHRLDAGLGPLFATVSNDLSRPFPTLAIAQRLWDNPVSVGACVGRGRALTRAGLLSAADTGDGSQDWLRPLLVPASVAQVLAGYSTVQETGLLREVSTNGRKLDEAGEMLSWRLSLDEPEQAQFVPLVGGMESDFEGWAHALSHATSRRMFAFSESATFDESALSVCATLAWQARADVVLPQTWLQAGKPLEFWRSLVASLAVRWFVPVADRRLLSGLPGAALAPAFVVPEPTFEQRVEHLTVSLGDQASRLRPAIAECARRFRLSERGIQRLGSALRSRPVLDAAGLVAGCRSEAQTDMGHLAQKVVVRFDATDLILPRDQLAQFQEVVQAMRSLATVHHDWGTAKVWNESGLAVLFCGPPGTGKTMAAEALANTLSLDMYRIDLSQVVNKYIGETEKNLKRIFDAAEQSDCLLFFDEADALFGKRTEVKDAHDRFANVEISYLLERMERLKGLAVLATNRRKDLDAAFLRRLRYVIEFPIPGVEERRAIWRAGFPRDVDTSPLDFDFLGKAFALSGGHIRSIIFNACLQAAARGPSSDLPASKVGRVEMGDVVRQLRRELQKINQPAGHEQFGVYAPLLEEAQP